MEDGIVVDTNSAENFIFEFLSSRGVPTKRERLDVGDILLRHGGETIVIERKKLGDLASSIASDHRYHEQKARQLAMVAADETGKTRIVWIVEGPLIPLDVTLAGGTSVRSVESAVIKTAVRDAIPILRAVDGKALSEMVLYMYEQLAKGGLNAEDATQKRIAEGYSGVVSVKKSKNSDSTLTWKMMLATVHGLSMTKATNLVERWPSPLALAKEIDGLDRKAAIKLVAAVETNKRKLGPVVAGRLVDVFQRKE